MPDQAPTRITAREPRDRQPMIAGGRISPPVAVLVVAALLIMQAVILHLEGHTLICPCGTLKLWHGITHSPENSQQIFDWYSFTHIVHGLALYFLIWLAWRNGPVAARLMVAVLIEGGWEVLENSQLVIDRYRAQTVWRGYYGDSIVNSISDTCMMILGFVLAWRLPVKAAVALVVIMEGALMVLIRDSLLLNIIMLIHPFEAIKAWQAAMPA
jgi:Protein of unknown function (DUF2585)